MARSKGFEAIVDIRRSRAGRIGRHLALFSAMLFVISALGHRYRLLETPGFVAVLAATGAMALLAFLLSAAGFRSVWRDGKAGARDIALGAIVSLAVLSPFGFGVWKATALPMLHDISTDTDHPPELAAPPAPMPGANAPATFDATMAQRQHDGYPDVVGRRYPAAPDRVLAAVKTLVASRGWTVLSDVSPKLFEPDPKLPDASPTLPEPSPRLPEASPDPTEASPDPSEASTVVSEAGQGGNAVTIQAEGRTTVLAFPFAVSIRIGDEGDTTVVDMRCASRYGMHDFGDNARRIIAFLTDLDAAIAKQAGA